MPISAKAALQRDGGKKDASLLTIVELAHREKVSTKTVQMWIMKGKLKDSAKKDADGIWRINKLKFKRPPGLAEQAKLDAAARKAAKSSEKSSAKKPVKPAPKSAPKKSTRKSAPKKTAKVTPAKK